MNRITDLVDEFQVTVQLAYYPPYHSKYNPVERAWSVPENHWNGSLLDTVETALNFAQTMSWNGCHPVVKLVEKTYQTGVRLTPKEMEELEKRFERLPGLEKWFVRIENLPRPDLWDDYCPGSALPLHRGIIHTSIPLDCA